MQEQEGTGNVKGEKTTFWLLQTEIEGKESGQANAFPRTQGEAWMGTRIEQLCEMQRLQTEGQSQTKASIPSSKHKPSQAE